jgi:hypothetical protein
MQRGGRQILEITIAGVKKKIWLRFYILQKNKTNHIQYVRKKSEYLLVQKQFFGMLSDYESSQPMFVKLSIFSRMDNLPMCSEKWSLDKGCVQRKSGCGDSNSSLDIFLNSSF